MRPRVSQPWIVAITVFATYLLAARGPRNLFPLSVFDMYQGHAPEVVARVLAVGEDGEAAELDAYEDWACDWDADLKDIEASCGSNHRPLEYVTRDQSHFLEAHAGHGTEAVHIVSRAYWVHDASRSQDCVLARCMANRGGR